jgi:hypothetical protein
LEKTAKAGVLSNPDFQNGYKNNTLISKADIMSIFTKVDLDGATRSAVIIFASRS